MEDRNVLGRLDRWLRIAPDGTVTVLTGKVEIGQGITTALAQCVADELDVAMERVRVHRPDTDESPDEGYTAGSRSIEQSGETLRTVAAEVRALLLERASQKLGADVASLTVADGVVRARNGAHVSYGELVDDELLAREATGTVAPKMPAARRVIGTKTPRLDLAAKITGAPAYVQDLVLPGMLHGRIVRPASPASRLRAVDEDDLRKQPGVVAVVRDGSFLGIVASTEIAAIRALRHARRIASWEESPTLPRTTDPRYLLSEQSEEHVAHETRDDAALARRGRTFSAEYSRSFIAHGALAPSCAVARMEDGRYTVWSHTQGVHPTRKELAKVLRVPVDHVRVIHMEGAGCYGHNGADDAALDAALLARAVPGKPVRVQWMRDDEFAWEPFGTATVVRVAASLDADGRVTEWKHDLWGHGHGNRPRSSPDDAASVLAARHLATPFRPTAPPRAKSLTTGALRNAAPLYRFPNQRIVDHYVTRQPFRVSALRSLGAHPNVFAIESFIDELAAAAGTDPIAFRLAHLDDERARAVIETVAAKSGWSSRPASGGDTLRGRGIGFARYRNAGAYFACVALVRLHQDIRVERVWGAVDAGMAVSPDGIVNQTEGGIVQATGWTLKEHVTYDDTRVTSLGWDSYPSITFSEVPEVDVTLIDRPEEPPLGVGEAFAGPVSAAIANAIYDATSVRLRDLPLTRERLVAAMEGNAAALVTA
jgi:nicotinate dehydrogenase subunit B